MNMERQNIAIVVLSFDGFKDLWQPFFDFFFDCWPDCPYEIYLLNNYKEYNDIRVNNLLVGEDISWSHSLIKGLDKIQEERVFFIYDDCFFKKINIEQLCKYFLLGVENDLISLQLRPSSFVSKFGANEPTLIPSRALYRNALFLNLIKRKHLLSILKPGESAWDFELNGNARSQEYNYFSIRRSFIDYDHGIVKGKWFNVINKKLLKKGYKFEKLDRTMSVFETINLKVKTRFYEFCLYVIPLNFVLKIENMRKNYIYTK